MMFNELKRSREDQDWGDVWQFDYFQDTVAEILGAGMSDLPNSPIRLIFTNRAGGGGAVPPWVGGVIGLRTKSGEGK